MAIAQRHDLRELLARILAGRMLRGVKFGNTVIETETVVMRSASGTVRWIRAEHRQIDKF